MAEATNPLQGGPDVDPSAEGFENKKRMPADTRFKQQRLPAFSPTLTPFCVIFTFLIIGVPFVLLGNTLTAASNAVVEVYTVYDGPGSSTAACQISSNNQGRECTVDMVAPEAMKAPVMVYYKLTNFYQNHRRYVKSISSSQMRGSSSPITKNCVPVLSYNGTDLNPCGMVANTLFNDQIVVTSGQDVSYKDIAWSTDAKLFGQPPGFKYVKDSWRGSQCGVGSGQTKPCADDICVGSLGNGFEGCKAYKCPADLANYYGCDANEVYIFYYPWESTTQYLYESYPEIVSPMKGVTEERFWVWMRLAALPRFRKMHAVINSDLAAGEHVTFKVTANFNVNAFEGSKGLVMTTTSWFGGKNKFLGRAFTILGVLCFGSSVLFGIRILASARKMGDLSYLQ